MKKQFLTKFALATLAITMCGFHANAQLGNLKNKVKNAANNATGGNNNSNTNTTTSNNSSSSNSANSSTNNTAATSSNGSKTGDDLKWYKVDKNTAVFSSDYGFSSTKTDFKTGENIFVRFAFTKSITDIFNEKFPNHQKSTANYNIAIAKNIDDENPIIITEGSFSLMNYGKYNMMDFSISADAKTRDAFMTSKGDVGTKLGGMSLATMANSGISVQWETQAPKMTGGKKDWEIFLIFSPGDKILDERAPEMVAQGKFSYTYDAKAGSSQYAASIKPKKITPDDGMTSDMHTKYVKQIVFSKNEIPKVGASDAALTTTFNLGDDIYSRAFLERSMLNEQNIIGANNYDGSFGFRIYVDGKLFTDMPGTKNKYKENGEYATDGLSIYQPARETSTTFENDLSRNWGAPKDKGLYYNGLLLDFYYNAWLLPAGAHKIKMETVFYIPADGALAEYKWTSAFGSEKILAAGEFTLNVTEAGKLTTAKKLCSMPDIKTETDYFKKPALTKAPQATEWVKKDITEKGTKATLIKVVEGEEWGYIKNGFGIILKRELWGTAFLQDNETKLYYTRAILFTQQNISSGGAKYGNTTWEWQDYDNAGKRFCKECIGK